MIHSGLDSRGISPMVQPGFIVFVARKLGDAGVVDTLNGPIFNFFISIDMKTN